MKIKSIYVCDCGKTFEDEKAAKLHEKECEDFKGKRTLIEKSIKEINGELKEVEQKKKELQKALLEKKKEYAELIAKKNSSYEINGERVSKEEFEKKFETILKNFFLS